MVGTGLIRDAVVPEADSIRHVCIRRANSSTGLLVCVGHSLRLNNYSLHVRIVNDFKTICSTVQKRTWEENDEFHIFNILHISDEINDNRLSLHEAENKRRMVSYELDHKSYLFWEQGQGQGSRWLME